MPARMKAAVFAEPGRILPEDKPIPDVGPNDALLRITTTTICGTDVHILKDEYPAARGLAVGREPVGVIERLGRNVLGCAEGRRAIAGAQAENLLVPDALASPALVPDDLSDEQVRKCPDIMPTGLAGAESGNIRLGDTEAVLAQGPIGLCATAGAKLRGATRIIAVDTLPERLAMARRLGADEVIAGGRLDLSPLVTHRFPLEQMEDAQDIFAAQRDGMMKVAMVN